LLKEAAPRVTRIAIIFNPEVAFTGPSYSSSIEAAARALGVQAIQMPVRNAVHGEFVNYAAIGIGIVPIDVEIREAAFSSIQYIRTAGHRHRWRVHAGL
jgi:hypothetical protein